MKILVLSHACVTPTNQQFFAEIEQQTGWQITIVTPTSWLNDYGKQVTPQRWYQFQGQLIDFALWKSGSIPLHTYRTTFRKLLKQLQPDVIYVQHEPYAIATFQLYLANALTICRPIGFFTWQNIEKRYPFPFRQMENWVLRQTHVMFPGSQSAEMVFRKKGYQGRSVRLPGSIDPTLYAPHPEAVSLKSDWCQSEEVVIGYLGRIVEEKGLKTLLHALKQIESRPWKLVMVGTGDYENEFNQIAQNLQLTDRILNLGFIPHDQAVKYLSAFDLLVIPSETRSNWKEQFGRVIIEAMACGTPVIGSDSGEIPYLIQSTQGGLTFPEGNVVALAAQLDRLVNDPELRTSLAHQGRESVIEKYSNRTIVSHFIQAIIAIAPLSQINPPELATVSAHDG
jgi:L-malate glycosyltransferase